MQLLGLKPKELAEPALAEGKDPVVADTIRAQAHSPRRLSTWMRRRWPSSASRISTG